MSLISQVTLANQLDSWPYDKKLPFFFLQESRYLNLHRELNRCILADGSFLKDAEANTQFGKAYRYWIHSSCNMDEWAQLGLDAPQEVELVGRYLLTKQRINCEIACENDPDWMKRDFSCCKKIAVIFIISGIIGLLATGIFLTLKYHKK